MRVFTCPSQDMIAHELTHAVIDGIRTYFTGPTNPDVLAFHEGFADLCALFAHFSHKEALTDAIRRTGGRADQNRRKRKVKDSEEAAGTGPAEANGHQAVGGNLGTRVRMYRVGSFFLVTVPANDGPAHILIDCGVHAADIGSINECIQVLKKTTKNRLALVILTHYHADHMSGFASNYDDFANFDHIGAVWITNRLADNAAPVGRVLLPTR